MIYHDQQMLLDEKQIQKLTAAFPVIFCEYLDYLAEINRSSKTRLGYAYDLHVFSCYLTDVFAINTSDITPTFLAGLKPSDIQHFLAYAGRYKAACKNAAERCRTNATSAKARKLAAIRGLYKYMMADSLCAVNPAALVQIPKRKSDADDVTALDGREVKRMIQGTETSDTLTPHQKAFANKTRMRDTALLLLFLGTGIRISELVGIDLPDIDWETRSVMVFRKEGKKQRVFMTNEAASAVKEYITAERKVEKQEKALFVSPRTGARLSVRSVENIVKKYATGITNKDVHAHTLRATYATNLYSNTDDIKLVADALGHKNLATVSKYTRSNE